MVQSNQITVGMMILIKDKLYKVLSVSKVSGPKGDVFIKVEIKEHDTDIVTEKNFKLGQEVQDVNFENRTLEFLYREGDGYLFLDIGNYEKVFISGPVMKDKFLFLKAGISLTAVMYVENVFSIELPHFLELMVSKTDFPGEDVPMTGGNKRALLETGVEVFVPPFIEIGDVIKVDTRTSEYIQRV
ncbi:MAG: elongation factor P [Victivallaceae bacterium]